ncbi:hypothetical protein [Pectobacterium phage vB_ParM-25]|nr:hypothetical protein [Serratia phage BUCT660]URG14020.1 hypothetical protein [Pectobacterium phage vB_ParM-25]
MMKSKVISGFPGVGKSTLFNTGLNCSDSDSSKFDKSLFPGNYISHIQKLLNSGELDFVFVSSHEIVRDALISAEIPFTLVYPCLEAKADFIERYKSRGSPEGFINLLDNNFESWVRECQALNHPLVTKIELAPGQFLSDVI